MADSVSVSELELAWVSVRAPVRTLDSVRPLGRTTVHPSGPLRTLPQVCTATPTRTPRFRMPADLVVMLARTPHSVRWVGLVATGVVGTAATVGEDTAEVSAE